MRMQRPPCRSPGHDNPREAVAGQTGTISGVESGTVREAGRANIRERLRRFDSGTKRAGKPQPEHRKETAVASVPQR